jgi:hypothetical protein
VTALPARAPAALAHGNASRSRELNQRRQVRELSDDVIAQLYTASRTPPPLRNRELVFFPERFFFRGRFRSAATSRGSLSNARGVRAQSERHLRDVCHDRLRRIALFKPRERSSWARSVLTIDLAVGSDFLPSLKRRQRTTAARHTSQRRYGDYRAARTFLSFQKVKLAERVDVFGVCSSARGDGPRRRK